MKTINILIAWLLMSQFFPIFGSIITISNFTNDAVAYLRISDYYDDIIYESEDAPRIISLTVNDSLGIGYVHLHYNRKNTPIFLDADSILVEIYSLPINEKLSCYEFKVLHSSINTSYQKLSLFNHKNSILAMDLFHSFFKNTSLDSLERNKRIFAYDSMRLYMDQYTDAFFENTSYQELKLYQLNLLTQGRLKTPEELKILLNQITDSKLMDNHQYKNCKRVLNTDQLQTDDRISNFYLINDMGNRVLIDSLFNDGRNFILLWSTHCVPSINGLNALIEYADTNTSNTNIIFICIDSEYSEWVKFISDKHQGLALNQFYLPSDNLALLDGLWQSGTPYGILLERNKILQKNMYWKDLFAFK